MIQSMVEPAYGLNKDFRTMSTLASTIMPISDDLFPLKKSRSKSSTATSFSRTYEDDFRDGLQIPLPPSSTSSQSGGALSGGATRGDIEWSTEGGHTLKNAEPSVEEGQVHEIDGHKIERREDCAGDHGAWDEQVGRTNAMAKKPQETERVEASSPKEDMVTTVEDDRVNVPGSAEPTGEDTVDLPIKSEVLEYKNSKYPVGESVGTRDETIQDPSGKSLEDNSLEQQGGVIERLAKPLGNDFGKTPLERPSEQAVQDPQPSDDVPKDVPVFKDQSQQAPPEDQSVVSLQEVGLLVRKRDYEQQCLEAMQNEVQDLTHRCASVQRRICLQSHLYNLMLNHFRAENPIDFSSTYQRSVEARNPRTNLPDTSGPRPGQFSATPHDSWISKLSPTGAKTVIELLHQIRQGPTFLSDALVNLSSFQLGSLAQRTPDHSAAPSPQPGSSILSRSLDWSRQRTGHFSDAKPKLDPVHHSPLALLVYGVFDTPCSTECREGHLRRERLIDSCVRLISSGKKGSNDFVLSILETMVESSPWPSKLQLEQYITTLILDGDFVLESLEHQHVDFSEAATVSNARNAVATAEFYDRGLRTLLDLLVKDSTCSVIPDGVLDFIRSILSRIADSKQRSKARDFFVSRWYCSAFLSKALMYPEAHGMMMQHHISGAARQKILLEMARRLQQNIAEVLSSRYQGLPPTQEIQAGVQRLIACFEPNLDSQQERWPIPAPCPDGLDKHHLMLGPQEFLEIARALLPGLSHRSQPSLNPNDGSLGRSSTSSGTGSSTLTAATADQRTGTASSMAPSFSWTSIASMTTNSEAILSRPVEVMDDTDSSNTLIPDKKANPAGILEQPLDRRLTQVINEVEFLLARIPGGYQDTTRSLENNFACFRVCSSVGSLSAGHAFKDWSNEPQDDPDNTNTEIARRNRHDLESINAALLRSCRESPESLINRGPSGNVGDDLSPSQQVAACFTTNMAITENRQDFVSFHYWWRSLQILRDLPLDAQATLVGDLATLLLKELDCIRKSSNLCNSWLFNLRGRFKVRTDYNHSIEGQCDALRAKMWYVTDVKHSSAYDEAFIVSKALRSMARPPPPRYTGVAAWARHRLKTSIGSERAQAQVLEALSADPGHGGPGKLSDSQAERTSKWLIEQNVENFCKGEERLHRFCLEVRKTANKLVGENMGKSPALWSSTLFQTENRLYKTEGIQSVKAEANSTTNRPLDVRSAATMPRPNYPIGSFRAELGTYDGPFSSSLPAYDEPLIKATGPFVQSGGPPFPLSFPSKHTFSPLDSQRPHGEPMFQNTSNRSTLSEESSSEVQVSAKNLFLKALKKTVTSLLLSDLGSLLWNRGSETDRWISDEKLLRQVQSASSLIADGQSVLNPNSKATSATQDLPKEQNASPLKLVNTPSLSNLFTPTASPAPSFPFPRIFDTILKTFTLTSNPYRKIQLLYELSLLATHSIRDARNTSRLTSSNLASAIPTVRKPRTRTTRLEEVIANVEERRGSISSSRPSLPIPPTLNVFNTINTDATPSDAEVAAVLKPLLSDPKTRPKTLFRDLQYIAALLPTSYLDSTPEGKAFWTIGLIALGLKADLCTDMVKRASKIVTEYFEKPGGGGLASTGRDINGSLGIAVNDASEENPTETAQATNQEAVDLHAAARMYTLAALEGDPTAARELALFYFIHPELVPTVTLPLSRPGDVFRLSNTNGDKATNSGPGTATNPLVGDMSGGKDKGKTGGKTGEKGKGGEKGGLDLKNFALAWHWMEVAANGGDRDAVQFLRENGELGKGLGLG